MSQKFVILGFLFIFIGIIIIFISAVSSKSNSIKAGGIAFIGPIPISFASDKTMLYILMAFTILILILYILFLKKEV